MKLIEGIGNVEALWGWSEHGGLSGRLSLDLIKVLLLLNFSG